MDKVRSIKMCVRKFVDTGKHVITSEPSALGVTKIIFFLESFVNTFFFTNFSTQRIPIKSSKIIKL